MNNHKIWALVVLMVVFMLCITIIIAINHPMVIRFEMDNNTLEAVKSINYTMIK